MRLKKYIFLFILFWSMQTMLKAQNLSPLERGDQVPDLPIGHVNNYTNDILRLSDFKGQWILIDFWGAGCVGCVGGFPMLDSMQRRYEGKLKVLLVSKNSQEQLDKFIGGLRKKATLPNVPRITSDTVLGQFFPYVAVPYHVWIDPEGRFYAGTSSSNFTPANIDRLLAGARPYFIPSVYARYEDYTRASIIEVATGIDPKTKAGYSYFTGYVPKGSSYGYEGAKIDSVYNTYRRSFSNLSLMNLANQTVERVGRNKKQYLINNRIFLDIGDVGRVTEPDDEGLLDEWRRKNLYSYEIQVPLDQSESSHERVRYELLHYLKSYAGVTVYEDRRKIRAVKVKLRDGGAGIQADTTRLEYRLFPNLQRADFDIFFWRPIMRYYARQNIFFEKDFERVGFPVDITVGEHWQNLDSLKAILAPQGIDLVEEEVEDMVLVISDRAHLKPQIGPLATGQRVPDDFWERKHVLYHNGDTATIDLTAHQGKFVVLDFWNANCASCIHSFPHMLKLQEKYGDKLSIIAVNDKDSTQKVRDFYGNRMKQLGLENVATIVEDTYLSKLFHKAGYPHFVWITPGGNIIMQTFSKHFMSEEAVEHIMHVEGFFPRK